MQSSFLRFMVNPASSFEFAHKLSADMPVVKKISIEIKEVIEICENLNVNKSKGADELPLFLFHKLCISLFPSLTQKYRKILQTGEYTKVLKVAKVSALHKKNDKCDVSNPVSLLSIPS